jgi:RNA polymerase sigma-70 factor (ECF subfamily)
MSTTNTMGTAAARAEVARTFRQEAGQVLAALVSTLRDIELAEDALQDALVVALERWPVDGVPRKPGAWILTAARRKAIDRLRRASAFSRKAATLAVVHELEHHEEALSDDIPDERLALMFTCCHPALSNEGQVALTLGTLGGLTTAEIAAAFLVSEATMAQRLVRAKRKIRDAGIPYAVPPAGVIAERLDALLSVLYLIFNAGYNAPLGDQLVRPDLCAEAIRLARVLATLAREHLAPGDAAESLGLLALMLLHHARRAARVSPEGDLILLSEQDRTLWDSAMIDDGVATLDAALALKRPGAYQTQAAIAALHAQAITPDATDWAQIAALYGALAKHMPSPVVELNRAVAVAMRDGAAAGLALLEGLADALDGYYLFYAARADLLRLAGDTDGARAAYTRALDLCGNSAEQAFLRRRLDALTPQP